MASSKFLRFVAFVAVLAAAAVVVAQPADPPAKPASRPVPTKFIVCLHRIEIPEGSKHRDNEGSLDADGQPDLYIILYRNGTQVGQSSDAVEGFDVDYIPANERNHYEIDGSENATFRIVVYDYDGALNPDDQILDIAGLTAADFANFDEPIRERLDGYDTARAVAIYFKPIPVRAGATE